MSDEEEMSFPLLDNISSVFVNREIERRKKLEVIKSKEESNKVHVQYLRDNIISKPDYDRAGSVVSEWAKRNGNVSKEASRMLRNKRTTDLIPLSNETIKRRRLADSPSRQRSQAIEESANQNSDSIHSSVTCKIVNCEIVFDSELEFQKHNAGFQHTPCNPYRHLPNGKLLNFPLLYTCPKCRAQFQKKIDCQEHMIFKDHLPVLSPVAIYGYMCPQCCMIFHNIVQCHTHMSQTNHYNVTYSFSQDSGGESTTTKSILISDYLASHFYSKCLSKDYSVKCVTCKVEVKDVISTHQHTLSTGHQQYNTHSPSTTDEVFGEFLSDKSCDNCGKIIWNGDVEKGFHGCTNTEIGFLTDVDCTTFREFVHRCGIQENIRDNDLEASVQNGDHEVILGATSTDSNSSVITINSPIGTVGGVNQGMKLRNESVILLDTPDIGSSLRENFRYGSENASVILLDTPPAGIQDISKLRSESVMIVENPDLKDNFEVSNKKSNEPVVSKDEDDALDYLSIGDSSDWDSDDSDIVFTGSEECKPSVSNWVWNSKPDLVEIKSRTVTRSSMSPSKKVIQISKQQTESSTFSSVNPNDTNSAETKARSSSNEKNVFNNAYEEEEKKLSKKARYRRKKKLEKAKRLLLESEKPVDSKPSTSKISPLPVLKQSRDRSRSRSRSRSKSPHKPSGSDAQDSSKKHLSKPPPKKPIKINKGPETKNIPENMDSDISTENLSKMHLLIFLDLDNWTGFFKRLPQCLPDKTFVWTFYGGNTLWKEPKATPFLKLKRDRCFYLHSQCGKTKDAADFAICFTIGKMDDRLPKHVPFAILSGDRGFCEIENQMRNSSRRTVVIDPHEAVKSSEDMLYTMILSVMNS